MSCIIKPLKKKTAIEDLYGLTQKDLLKCSTARKIIIEVSSRFFHYSVIAKIFNVSERRIKQIISEMNKKKEESR